MGLYGTLVSWTQVLLLVLIIVKIFQMVQDGRGTGEGEGNTGDNNRRGGDGDNRRGDDPARNDSQPVPSQVIGFRGEHQGDRIALWWVGNPEHEHISYYEIERQSQMSSRFRFDRLLFGAWQRIVTINRNHTPENPFMDTQATRYVSPFLVQEFRRNLDQIRADRDYKYRIRAVNNAGKGPWAELRVGRPTHGWQPVIDEIVFDHDTREIRFTGHVE